MLRPVVFSFILAGAVSICSTAIVVMENGVPLLWAQTFSQLSEFPMNGNTVNPNPWNFVHRMSLYRLMISHTDSFMGSLGAGPAEGPLWGLPLQLAWMLNSGRLADPTGATNCGLPTGDTLCISPQSYFGCVSYLNSVLPVLSGAHNGLIGPLTQIEMEKAPGDEEYCTTYVECSTKHPEVMQKWDEFFKGIKTTSESSQPEDVKKDTLLTLFWTAEMASVHAAATCSARADVYSKEESSFSKSWVESAEYVAAAHFHSNMANSGRMIAPLPSRILRDDDIAPGIPDLSDEENHTVYVFSWMRTANTLLGGTMVNLWKRAMCSATTQEKGRQLLEDLTVNPTFAPGAFVSIMIQMPSTC